MIIHRFYFRFQVWKHEHQFWPSRGGTKYLPGRIFPRELLNLIQISRDHEDKYIYSLALARTNAGPVRKTHQGTFPAAPHHMKLGNHSARYPKKNFQETNRQIVMLINHRIHLGGVFVPASSVHHFFVHAPNMITPRRKTSSHSLTVKEGCRTCGSLSDNKRIKSIGVQFSRHAAVIPEPVGPTTFPRASGTRISDEMYLQWDSDSVESWKIKKTAAESTRPSSWKRR